MPSLKDLRNRIASVKSTQKITKAMQMVAVSKLRRAQAAAEAARPYADKVEAVLTNLAGAAQAAAKAPRLLAGTRRRPDPSARRLHRRARPLRRVQHLDRAPGARPGQRARRRGQDGQDPLRRQEGLRPASPHAREADPRDDRPARACARITYATAQPIADKVIEMFESGEFDVCTLFYARFKSVISQIPTAQQLIPPELGEKNETGADLRLRAGRERDPRRSCCRRR